MDLATNHHKTLTNYTAIYPYSQYYIDIVVDPTTRYDSLLHVHIAIKGYHRLTLISYIRLRINHSSGGGGVAAFLLMEDADTSVY